MLLGGSGEAGRHVTLCLYVPVCLGFSVVNSPESDILWLLLNEDDALWCLGHEQSATPDIV